MMSLQDRTSSSPTWHVHVCKQRLKVRGAELHACCAPPEKELFPRSCFLARTRSRRHVFITISGVERPKVL